MISEDIKRLMMIDDEYWFTFYRNRLKIFGGVPGALIFMEDIFNLGYEHFYVSIKSNNTIQDEKIYNNIKYQSDTKLPFYNLSHFNRTPLNDYFDEVKVFKIGNHYFNFDTWVFVDTLSALNYKYYYSKQGPRINEI